MLISSSIRYCYRNIASPCLTSCLHLRVPIKINHFCSLEPSTAAKLQKQKTNPVPKINLVSGTNFSITTVEEAQKLAKRRDLKLVKIIDVDIKTQRPVYKLMTGAEYHQEDMRQREERKNHKNNSFIKGEKLLLLNDSISEHDLMIHSKKVLKWLSKSFQIKIVISGNSANMDRSENVYKSLEKLVGIEGRFLQKVCKGSDLKFQIIPPKKEDKGS